MSHQLTIDFEPGLTERHRCLRHVMVAQIYSRGLTNVAEKIFKSPGNLSVELQDDGARHFSVDSLELYLDKYQDYTPIYYLIAKYLGDKAIASNATLSRIESLLAEAKAGIAEISPATKKPTKR